MRLIYFFLFLEIGTDRNAGSEANCDLTPVNMQYTEIVKKC